MMPRRFTVYTSLLTGDFVVTFGNEAFSEGIPVVTCKNEQHAHLLATRLNTTVTEFVETHEGAIRGGH